MANQSYVRILKNGVDEWNQWRQENPTIKPDLSGADLTGIDLFEADLKSAILSRACLIDADLSKADLKDSFLDGADFFKTDLIEANLTGANLVEATVIESNLTGTILTNTNLRGADLRGSSIIGATLNGAILSDCRVYGVSAWGLKGLEEAEQSNLVITPEGESAITVDNLEVAQFIYLLISSKKIRNVIDTITSKVVLILGRFTPDRKEILDAIREQLRNYNYLPILFDFEKPASRDLTETILTLAGLAHFVVADITDPRSIPQELTTIVEKLPSVPVQPILLTSTKEYGMFEHFKSYPWVLETYYYNDKLELLNSLGTKVIVPAEQKIKELTKR